MRETINHEGRREQESVGASFEVAICFTRNATWQGRINWLQKNQQQNFRSALEMLKLMDEALAEGAEAAQAVSWAD